ncbi:Amino acid adenylation [Xenorhabdus szentirmaii]|nr:Amino acid adenylation [Xenorhabdus szentirmaii]
MSMSCHRINNEAPSSMNKESSHDQFSLSTTQQVVWLDQILRPDSPCYNIGSVVLIEGELDEALLMRAFETVVDRHDALRLRLLKTQGLPLQTFRKTVPVEMTIHDFSDYADAEEHTKKFLRNAFMHPFDLNGELWFFNLIRVGNKRWYWQFLCHHLIGDSITLKLIPEYIADAYNHLLRGEEFTEIPPSYLDFMQEDSGYLNSQRYIQDKQFWQERYKHVSPTLISPHYPLKSASLNPLNRYSGNWIRICFSAWKRRWQHKGYLSCTLCMPLWLAISSAPFISHVQTVQKRL